MGKAAVLREKSLLQARGRRVTTGKAAVLADAGREGEMAAGAGRVYVIGRTASSWRAGGWVGVMRVK